MNFGFVEEGDSRCIDLRAQLDDFYRRTSDYTAFQEPGYQPQFWTQIIQHIASHLASNDSCNVLEFGAGRTSFGDFLGALRRNVRFHVQDVTPQNRDYLSKQADVVYISDIHDIDNRYDIIFSTFVWEHLTDPRSVLDHLLGLLNPGGNLFIVSPRYDFPYYLSPSSKHLSTIERIKIALWLFSRRLRVFLGGTPDFFIHLDPAVFHRPWFRDADAIHWVSYWDLKRYLSAGYEVTRLRVPVAGIKARFWEACLLMFVQIRRTN